jgi:ABC-2 type transport system permease protein
MSNLAWAVSDCTTMIRRSLKHVLRNVDSLLMSVMLPIILLLLFVYVFGGAMNTDTSYVNYVVPGIIILCAGFGSATTAVSVASDMAEGIIDRLRSLPILSSAVLVGHVVATVARNAISTGLVIGTAYLAGFRPHADLPHWLGALGVLLLFMLAISWVSVCLGLVARSAEGASGFTFFILFLPYLSSAFVPTETMPTPLRVLAEHQPITPVTETVRGLLMGTPIGNNGWLAVAWLGGILLVSYTAAAILFRRRTAH